MVLSRKDFLLSTAGLFAAAGGIMRSGFKNAPLKGASNINNLGMLYDSSKCIGCRMCEQGCIKKNNLPEERILGKLTKTSWTAIQTTKTGNGQNTFLKLQCLHCTDASCVSVCPVGAAAHHGEAVVIDPDKCIGCGYCEKACPFGVPHKSPPEGAAEKCTFCNDLIEAGSKPACAKACPTGGTIFGSREDLLIAAESRVEHLKKLGNQEAGIYGKDLLGGLNIIYILQKPPAFYGLPEQPKQATDNTLSLWTSGSIGALALVAPFWYLYNRYSKKEKKLINDDKKEGS